MKKIFIICQIAIFLLLGKGYAQDVNGSPLEVSAMLAKIWEVDYAMMGTEKIGRMPDAANLIYNFKADHTLVFSNGDKDKSTGTWNLDEKNKQINLLINGTTNSTVISLKPGEMIMFVHPGKDAPPMPGGLKLVFKIKS